MIEIYTDGACRKNDGTAPASWAMAVYFGDEYRGKKSGIINPGTNNQAELEGVIQALSWSVKYGVSHESITIHTDSAYVCNGCNTWLAGWKQRNWVLSSGEPVKNKEYWQRIDELLHKVPTNLAIKKVKGHSGNVGNDKADSICNDELDKYEV